MTTRSAEAALKRREAARSRELAAAFPVGSTDATALYHMRHAAELEAEAQALLMVDGPREVAFGETAPDAADRDYVAAPALTNGWLRETLQDPDAVAVEASFSRQTRLIEADVLEAGLDAAKTIGARDSLEKMLAHQLAAAHTLAMKFVAQTVSMLELIATANRPERYSVEAARLANTSARLMETYQRGLLTLERLRNGGRQTVTVEHVQVNGQAIIGNVQTEVGTPGRTVDNER